MTFNDSNSDVTFRKIEEMSVSEILRLKIERKEKPMVAQVTRPEQQNIRHDPYQSAARQREDGKGKKKPSWPGMKSWEEQFEEDRRKYKEFRIKMKGFKKPKKIEVPQLPPHVCDLCVRLQAQRKGEKSLKDVLNEMLSQYPRKYEYINIGPDRFKDDKNTEPVIYVSRIMNKGKRKIAIEAHDFEYDHTTIKLTKKEIAEQNIEVYPCFKPEFIIDNISITDQIRKMVRNLETEEKESESLHEEPETGKEPEGTSKEPDPVLEDQESLNKRAESLRETLLSLRDQVYNSRKKGGLFKV